MNIFDQWSMLYVHTLVWDCKLKFKSLTDYYIGGAVGASSVLLIYPRKKEVLDKNGVPQGVVVAIICNMQSVGLSKLAMDIAKMFETMPPAHNQPYKVRKIEDC